MIHVTLLHSVDCLVVVGYRDPREAVGYLRQHWYRAGYSLVIADLVDRLDDLNWNLGYDALFLNKENWDDGCRFRGEAFFPLEKYFDKIVNTR